MSFKAGFHMITAIATIAAIAAIAAKKVRHALRSYGKNYLAIVAIAATVVTKIAEVDLSPLNDRSGLCDHMETALQRL